MRDLVWRLEGPDGDGAYSTGVRGLKGDYFGANHPAPREDPVTGSHYYLGDVRTDRHLFGFASITQARRWWYCRPDLEEWTRRGWTLVAHRRSDLERIHESRNQLIFVRPKGTPTAKLRPNLLHNRTAGQLAEIAHLQLNEETGR